MHSTVNSEWWGGSGRVDEALLRFICFRCVWCFYRFVSCFLNLKKKKASINKTYASKGKGKESHCFPALEKEKEVVPRLGKSKETGLTQERGIRGSVMLWCLGEVGGGHTHVMVYTSPRWRREAGGREWGEIEILTLAECAEGYRSRGPAGRAWNKASTK